MSTKYGEEALRRVKNAWKNYQQSTGTNQERAAKAMGMSQSAWGQYLRGDIPLNENLLYKFCALTDMDVTQFGLPKEAKVFTPSSYGLKVSYTLSGRKINEVFTVNSVLPTTDCFGILVDHGQYILPKGSVIVVDPSAKCRADDRVALITETKIYIGTLDFSQEEWRLIHNVWGGSESLELKKGSRLVKISCIYFPEGVGKPYEG